MTQKRFALSMAAMVVAATTSTSTLVHADGYNARVDDHAPIGVMADHYHKAGEFMASARYMHMDMGEPLSAMGPQKMTNQMAMVGMMYAPTDWVTFAAGTGYSFKNMKATMNGNSMTRKADGMTDLKINAIFPVYTHAKGRLLIKLGTSLPTGKSSAVDMNGNRLPLMVQSGKGSYALTPAITYSHFEDGWSYGLQGSALIVLDKNNFDEKAGDQYNATAWGSYSLTDQISASLRMNYSEKQVAETAMIMGGANSESLMTLAGVNYVARHGALSGHRFALEFGMPLSSNRGGHALKSKSMLVIGWQKAF